jgi:hypothetical protein
MKAIKYIAIGLGTFFTGRYILSLGRAKKKVITTVSGQRDSITAQGINILVKFNIKNPTRAHMSMTAPLIKLSANGKLLASSTIPTTNIPTEAKDSNGRIKIEAYKETGEITTKILVPWLSVISISPQLLARLQSSDPSDKVKLELETNAQLFTGIANFPYEEKTTLTI